MRLIKLFPLFTFAFLSVSSIGFADYNRILVCDAGQVWVDVNPANRTELQLVSRDSRANYYLNHELQAYASYEGGQDGTWETVWRGVQPRGVFTASDFQGATLAADFTRNSIPSFKHGEWIVGYREYVSFFRVGMDGLKVQVTLSNVSKCVNNNHDPKFGRCAQGTYYAGNEYVGDWTFTGCHY